MATAATTNYVPGVCNINPVEIKKRRMSGHIGLALTIILTVIAFSMHVLWIFKIVVIIPAFISAIGYLQARNKFCVGFASSKQQHADDDGDIVTITDKQAIAKDRQKVRSMNLQATIIAAAVTAVVCVIPL
jgi:hypothetical protein